MDKYWNSSVTLSMFTLSKLLFCISWERFICWRSRDGKCVAREMAYLPGPSSIHGTNREAHNIYKYNSIKSNTTLSPLHAWDTNACILAKDLQIRIKKNRLWNIIKLIYVIVYWIAYTWKMSLGITQHEVNLQQNIFIVLLWKSKNICILLGLKIE